MQFALQLVLDRADGNSEDTLAATEHVDDFVGAGGGIDGGAVRKKRDIGRAVAPSAVAGEGSRRPDGSSSGSCRHPATA